MTAVDDRPDPEFGMARSADLAHEDEVERRTERLRDRLLGGEARRERRGREVALLGREEARPQRGHALDRRHEPTDVDDVDPHPDDHAGPPPAVTRR